MVRQTEVGLNLEKALAFILRAFVPGGAPIFLFLLIQSFAPALGAVEEVNLESLLKSALGKNAQIQEADGDTQIAKAQLERARAASFPKAEAILIAAPIMEQTGDALRSTTDWSKWGPFLKGGVQIVQPLYTFGQIGNYKKAAQHQINAREGQTEMKRLEVLNTLKETYYGYLLATDLERLVDELAKFLGDAVVEAEEQAKKKKKGGVKPHDLFKLKTAYEDLNQKKLMATTAKQTAEKALMWMAAASHEKIPAPRLKPEDYERKTLDDYIKLAKISRPEFKALAEGQLAHTALADAKRAQSYPVLFAGAFVSQGWAPNHTYQPSVFANDPFNQTMGGVGLGVKFDLEFWRHSAEAQEEQAQAMKLKSTEAYAVPGMELQVRKAYYEFEMAANGLEIAERRKTLGKKWFIQSAMGWTLGITTPKDLLEALEGEGLARKNYLETVYMLNLSLSRLSQAVGKEITKLNYR